MLRQAENLSTRFQNYDDELWELSFGIVAQEPG